jgi:hypothetical protein
MNKTITAIKRGVKAAVAESFRPRQFEAGGKPIVCSHCGSSSFERYRTGVLDRAKIGFAGYALSCCQCSHLEYFAKEPSEIETAA